MTLPFADKCAAALTAWLTPFAVRLEIAGSVRRRRPECGDLDVVVIPVVRELKDLLGAVIKRENLLAQEVRRRVEADGWTMRTDGAEIVSFLANGLQADIFFTEPLAWGSVLLCRTGSPAHNIWLAQQAQAMGGKWHPTRGLYLHGKVIGESEEAIYNALGLPYLGPTVRELGSGR